MSDNKPRITKDTVPQDFTLGLVLVDAIPVLEFGAVAILMGILMHNPLFMAFAILCFLSGFVKVLWKLIVVTAKKNIWPLFMQMRIVMPASFLGMIAAMIINRKNVGFQAFLQAIVSFPSVIFFGIGLFGMVLMMIFAFKLDSSDVKANWLEQITNSIAQASILVGIILLF